MNQNTQVLNYLLEGNKVTSLEALSKWNILRLSARIYDIKQMGYEVSKEILTTSSGKHVASYYIKD